MAFFRKTIAATVALALLGGVGLAQDTPAQTPAPQQQSGPVTIPLSALGPTEALALLRLAVVAVNGGNIDSGRDLLREGYRRAETPRERYEISVLAARLAMSQEAWTAAQVWLRRADQAAPNERAQQDIAQAYRTVSRRNPFSVFVEFGGGPSDNVNNGADTLIIVLGGIPFELSSSEGRLDGWEAEAGISMGYRVSESENHATTLRAQLHQRRVWLSDAAKEEAPDAENDDFESTTVVLGGDHRFLVWPEVGPSTVALNFGKSRYGGRDLAEWGEILLQQDIVQEGGRIRLGFSARSEDRADDPVRDSESNRLSATYFSRTEAGHSWRIGTAVSETRSQSALIDKRVLELSAARGLGRIGPMDATLSGTLSRTDYTSWTTTADGRIDDALDLRLEAVLPEVSYFGFVPKLTLSHRRTLSNVDIYSRSEFSVGLTAQSRF